VDEEGTTERERMGDGYFSPATTFQFCVSKTLTWPSRAPVRSRSPLPPRQRLVTVFWWFLSRCTGFAATMSSTDTVLSAAARTVVPEGIGRTASTAAACLNTITALPPPLLSPTTAPFD